MFAVNFLSSLDRHLRERDSPQRMNTANGKPDMQV